VIHDLASGVRCLVSFLLVEPVDDFVESLGDIVLIWGELRIVIDGSSLIEVWLVDEMPALLVGTSFVLDVIGKSGTFDEWVVIFFGRKFRVLILKVL